MFFKNTNLADRKTQVLKQLPQIPETGWTTPKFFPNLLGNVKAIALDVETYDPELTVAGPGWARGIGHIVGFSIGVIGHCGTRQSWYFPVRHEVEPWDNLDPAHAFAWVKPLLETPDIPKVGANLIYDVGWFTTEDIVVQGEMHDVQFAEALLHPGDDVNLEWLGKKYCNEGKASSILYAWCAKAYGGNPTSKQRANIYRAPPRLVGHYAQSDADLPLHIAEVQFPELHTEGLDYVYRMECDLIPLTVAIQKTGVRVDLERAEIVHRDLGKTLSELNAELYRQSGIHANVNSGSELAPIFDKFGIKYPMTPRTNKPSIVKGWLEKLDHPVGDLIRSIREHEKIRNTFIESYILNKNINGRIHCSFHPLKGESGGTITGRYSSSKPNLQNIPKRGDLGKEMRRMFLPDEGHIAWESADYSQIEYRCLAHFAVGPGADRVRAEYNADPNTDYHKMTQRLVYEHAQRWIERSPIKNINFGLLYGMGEPRLGRDIGVDKLTGKEIFRAYHEGNPYVKATMEAAVDFVEKNGFIRTILGRKGVFDLWEPEKINWDNRAQGLKYDQAIRTYGSQIIRAYTHKAVNTELQGTAADIIKEGMRQSYKAGVYDVIGVPKIQVHDELNNSVIANNKEQNDGYREHKHIMQTAVGLNVPIILTRDRGANWGDAIPGFCECPGLYC